MNDEFIILKWQDKLGPFCRSAVDCAIVLDAIRGTDAGDPSSREIALEDPFHVDITKLTVGYLDSAEMEVIEILNMSVSPVYVIDHSWSDPQIELF
jgi:Asp-tRNA(Asn)/Glu-tRNA(Gln) amidotransferase A subunit family amidase